MLSRSLLHPLQQSHNQPIPQKHCLHFLQHLTGRQDSVLGQRTPTRRKVPVEEGVSVVGEAITTKDEEDLKTDLKKSMPFQTADRGY